MILENLLNNYKSIAQNNLMITDHSHIVWMCDDILKNLKTIHDDKVDKLFKINRWLGFIQGWLYSCKLKTIDVLRNETRGIDDELFEILDRG